jgi:hypothetical protein
VLGPKISGQARLDQDSRTISHTQNTCGYQTLGISKSVVFTPETPICFFSLYAIFIVICDRRKSLSSFSNTQKSTKKPRILHTKRHSFSNQTNGVRSGSRILLIDLYRILYRFFIQITSSTIYNHGLMNPKKIHTTKNDSAPLFHFGTDLKICTRSRF